MTAHLYAVKPGRILQWPRALVEARLPVPDEHSKKPVAWRKEQIRKANDPAVRGREGYVVDLSAPYERVLLTPALIRSQLQAVDEMEIDGRKRPKKATPIEEEWVLTWMRSRFAREADVAALIERARTGSPPEEKEAPKRGRSKRKEEAPARKHEAPPASPPRPVSAPTPVPQSDEDEDDGVIVEEREP